MSDALHVNGNNVHSPYFIFPNITIKHLEQGLIYPSNKQSTNSLHNQFVELVKTYFYTIVVTD